MPRTLNRAGRYGWSRAYSHHYGSKQIHSDKYLKNYDNIQWDDTDDSQWEQVRRTGQGFNKGFAVRRKFDLNSKHSLTQTAGDMG